MTTKFHRNERRGSSVVSSLKSLWRYCNINNPRDYPPITDDLRRLSLNRLTDCLSKDLH
ncbi:hypothetical protein DEO72_LG3g3461 [Vigna unguiculata]|uniref:Uncharacterized protein n=1 Tax=Vigna unguiculata TaxID=3917 RepID=A0A4D6LJM6_VIGUN|nr:hypothetical protein DEO72_LG3g3461 [Vigna unguiculata]